MTIRRDEVEARVLKALQEKLRKVTTLAQGLEHPETRTEAFEALRGLIHAIVMTPA